MAVDNTSPSPVEWQPLIDLAHMCGAEAVAYWFPPDVAASAGRNAVRVGRARVPDVGFYATLKRLRRPTRGDGFDRVQLVRFDGAGGFVVRSAEELEN